MKMSKPSLNPSWPLILTGVCSGLLGAVLSATVVMLYHVDFVRQAEGDATKLRNKISVLEIALNQAQPFTASLEEAAPPAAPVEQPSKPEVVTSVQPQTPPAAAPQSKPVAPPAATAKPAQAPTPTAKAPPPAPQPAPQQAAAAQVAPVAQQAPAAPPPPVVAMQSKAQPVTAEELAAASAKKIEVMAMARVGVAKLHPNEVEFASGRRVRTGELFPSGEKLLKVDPVDGRIVTNERQLIVFDQ